MDEVLAAIGLVVVAVLGIDMVLDAFHLRLPLHQRVRHWRRRQVEGQRALRREVSERRRASEVRGSSAPVPLDEAAEPKANESVQWDGNVARPDRFNQPRRHNRN